jgi:hypothetical protein
MEGYISALLLFPWKDWGNPSETSLNMNGIKTKNRNEKFLTNFQHS